MVSTTLSKWGSGAGIHVSKKIMTAAGVRLGDKCVVDVSRPGVISLDFTAGSHRPVLRESVTFSDVFAGKTPNGSEMSDPWAGVLPVGKEQELWGSL